MAGAVPGEIIPATRIPGRIAKIGRAKWNWRSKRGTAPSHRRMRSSHAELRNVMVQAYADLRATKGQYNCDWRTAAFALWRDYRAK